MCIGFNVLISCRVDKSSAFSMRDMSGLSREILYARIYLDFNIMSTVIHRVLLPTLKTSETHSDRNLPVSIGSCALCPLDSCVAFQILAIIPCKSKCSYRFPKCHTHIVIKTTITFNRQRKWHCYARARGAVGGGDGKRRSGWDGFYVGAVLKSFKII